MSWPLRYGIFEHHLHDLIHGAMVNIVLNRRYATHYNPQNFWVATAVVKDMSGFMHNLPSKREYLEQSTPLEAIPDQLRSYGPIQFELLTPDQLLLCEGQLDKLMRRVSGLITQTLEVDGRHPPLPEHRNPNRALVLIDELTPIHRASDVYVNGGEVWR